MRVRYILKKNRIDQNGTTGSNAPINLVTGTVLQIAGSGLGLTSPPSAPLGLFFIPYTEHQRIVEEATIRPVVRRPTKSSGRHKKKESERVATTMFDTIAALEKQAASPAVVLREHIKHLNPNRSAIKLAGRQGGACSPSKKYFDVDLDKYQVD